MITNCPNCGAVIDRAGNCGYCGSRLVQTLDIFHGNAFEYGSITELNINVMDPYGKNFIIPLRGSIEGVEITCGGPYEENEVEFTFRGRIRE